MISLAHLADPFDCQRCGACCTNLPQNAAEGFVAYVEVAVGDLLFKRPDLVAKYTTLDANGVRHMQLAGDGRCKALRGTLGGRVRCEIYHHRPIACRRVTAETEECRMFRAAHDIRPA